MRIVTLLLHSIFIFYMSIFLYRYFLVCIWKRSLIWEGNYYIIGIMIWFIKHPPGRDTTWDTTKLFPPAVRSLFSYNLVFERTHKYWTLNTLNIEWLNIELSEHHILAQNRTLKYVEHHKNQTVCEHQTVNSKTSLVT